MSEPNAVLAEPLTLGQGTISRGTWNSGKVAILGSLFIGLAFVVFLNPMASTRSEVEAPAIDVFGTSPMSTCPRSSAVPTSVNAIENTLKNHGIAITPVAKFALTSAAATRDVSMAAHAKEEFSKLDPVTQAKFKKLSQDIVVRAGSLKPEEMAGVTAPLGFFDPVGFSADATEGKIRFYREVELKHGRLGMLAALGFLVGENFHPLFGGDIDVPAYLAFQQTPLQTFWPVVVFVISVLEVFSVFTFESPLGGQPWTIRLDHEPGDLGFDPLGLKPTDPKELKEMQTKELNNGRLAMLAAAGMIAQELATGEKLF